MKLFTNKKIWQKIIIIVLFSMMFQFIMVTPVHAIDGGVLLKPVVTLFVSIGDMVMAVVQDVLMQTDRIRRRNFNTD